MESKKPNLEEIINHGSADAIAVFIYFDILNEQQLEKLTFEQCLEAAGNSLFKEKEDAEKIYNLLFKKVQSTEDFVSISKEENLALQKEEAWHLAKKAAKSSWDFYILFLHASEENSEKNIFFEKIQDNIKTLQEVKKILHDSKIRVFLNDPIEALTNPGKPFSHFTAQQEFLLIEPVKKSAETFDDFCFLFLETDKKDEKFKFFQKMKILAKTPEEIKSLFECSIFLFCERK